MRRNGRPRSRLGTPADPRDPPATSRRLSGYSPYDWFQMNLPFESTVAL